MDQGTGEFKEWTDLIDRGGLCHVKQTTFQLFHALEYQLSQTVRDILKSLERPCKVDLMHQQSHHRQWCSVIIAGLIATADFEIVDKKNHDALLKMIVDLYVREIQTIYRDLHNEQRVCTENFTMMP